jgi:hypothetical protein
MGLVFQRIGLVFQRIRLVFQTDYYLNPLRACPPSVRHSYGEIHSQQLLLLLQLLPRAVLVLLFWRLLLWLCFVIVAVFSVAVAAIVMRSYPARGPSLTYLAVGSA